MSSKQSVITVTANPAIDQTVVVPHLQLGQVNTAQQVLSNAGGKGVNVASCLADWGVPVAATGYLGAGNVSAFEALMVAKHIGDHFVRLDGNTRTNIKLVSADTQATTDVNLPGFNVPEAAQRTFLTQLEQVQAGQIVVMAGSLPPNLPANSYVTWLETLADCEAQVVLDTSGAPLTHVLAQTKALPMLVKPNQHELAAWIGHDLPTLADVRAAAQQLHAHGIATVVVSLGEQGALLSHASGCWHARALSVTPISTVGAGDAMVAGLVAGMHAQYPWQDTLRLGVAFATAKLHHIGPHLPDTQQVQAFYQQVNLERLA